LKKAERHAVRGAAEVALAKKASARLMQLLNPNAFVIEAAGTDRYDRTLATIRRSPPPHGGVCGMIARLPCKPAARKMLLTTFLKRPNRVSIWY
jgi:hypothetical protein